MKISRSKDHSAKVTIFEFDLLEIGICQRADGSCSGKILFTGTDIMIWQEGDNLKELFHNLRTEYLKKTNKDFSKIMERFDEESSALKQWKKTLKLGEMYGVNTTILRQTLGISDDFEKLEMVENVKKIHQKR